MALKGLRDLFDEPAVKALRMVDKASDSSFVSSFRNQLTRGLAKLRSEFNKPRDFSPTFQQAMGETEALAGRFLKGSTLGAIDPFEKSRVTDFMFDRPLSESPSKGTAANVAGFLAEEAPSLVVASAGAKALKPMLKPLQQVAGKTASKLISSGGTRKLLGKGLAGISKGLPFTAAYSALSKARNKDYGAGDVGADLAFDAGLAMIPSASLLAKLPLSKADDVPGSKTAARKKLSDLWHYTDRLIKEKGFSPEAADKIGFQKGMGLLESARGKQADDLYNALQQADVKKKANIFDLFWTPELVFEKIGVSQNAKEIRRAHENYLTDLKGEIVLIKGWDSKLDEIVARTGMVKKEANKRIFNWLDGNLSKKELTSEELALGREVKSWYSTWASKLGIKLPQTQKISDYITHIFERGSVEKEFDQELAKLIKGKLPKSVYNPFKELRLGKMGYIEDFVRATAAYAKRATRDFNMTPALKNLEDVASKLDNETYEYLQKVASGINLRPTTTDTLIDNFIKSSPIGYKYGARPTNVLSKWFRRTVFRGTLGLNFNAALKNLSQFSNTYAELKEKYTALGYADLISKSAKGNLDELYTNNVLIDKFVDSAVHKARKSNLEKLDPVLFSLFEGAEKINRGAAYFGAKRRAIAKGLSETAAIEEAKALVRKTQFAFGPMDLPVILRGDSAKVVFQYQSYGIKQLEFLKNLIKDKNFKGMVRYIASTVVFYSTVGKLLSYTPKLVDALIPSFSPAETPIARLVGGTGELLHGHLTGDAREIGQGKWKLKSMIPAVIPGGVQLKRTFKWLLEGGPEGNIEGVDLGSGGIKGVRIN